MTSRIRGSVQAGDAAQPLHPLGHDLCGLAEQGEHRLPGVVGEAVEQRGAGPEFHAALGVDHPHGHDTGCNRRAQPGQQGPDDAAFAGSGGPGDQQVAAQQPDGPCCAGLAAPDRDAQEVNLAGRLRDGDGNRVEQGVAVVHLDEDFPGFDAADLDGERPERVRQGFALGLPGGDGLAEEHPHAH